MLKKLYNSQDTERNKVHCKYQSMTDMLKKLYNTQDTERNEIQVDLIKSELIDLKKWNWKYEFGNEQPNKIINIVEKVLDFNNQNQAGQGLKY